MAVCYFLSHSVSVSDVRNRLFYFGSVSVRFLRKNSDSVLNVFGSVRLKNAIRFRYYSYLLLI